jgi:Family of unknown function (DUF6533)
MRLVCTFIFKFFETSLTDPSTLQYLLVPCLYAYQPESFILYHLRFSCVLQIYDYFLTVHLEIKLIWFSRWTYTKILFLLVRYTTFITMALVLYCARCSSKFLWSLLNHLADQTFLDIPVERCKVTFPASICRCFNAALLNKRKMTWFTRVDELHSDSCRRWISLCLYFNPHSSPPSKSSSLLGLSQFGIGIEQLACCLRS